MLGFGIFATVAGAGFIGGAVYVAVADRTKKGNPPPTQKQINDGFASFMVLFIFGIVFLIGSGFAYYQAGKDDWIGRPILVDSDLNGFSPGIYAYTKVTGKLDYSSTFHALEGNDGRLHCFIIDDQAQLPEKTPGFRIIRTGLGSNFANPYPIHDSPKKVKPEEDKQ